MMNHPAIPQADGDDGNAERTNLMSIEQDEAIRLLQRQVKALQDYIDNRLSATARVGDMVIGVDWPKD